MLGKEEIWDRLKYQSRWLTTTRTAIFAAAISEHNMRRIVAIWLNGNVQVQLNPMLEKYIEGLTWETIFCPIPVPPTDLIQIPVGSYSVTDPIFCLEGGSNLYGKTDVTGHSLNVTVAYWDNEV